MIFCPKKSIHCYHCGEYRKKLYCGRGYDIAVKKKVVHVNEIAKMVYCPLFDTPKKG